MELDLAFVMLFAVSSAVAIAARRLGIPYTVALVLTGLALGATRAFEPPHLTQELLFAVILPGLLFEAAFHLDFSSFWRNKLAIHALAVPGVLASIALTAAILVPAANALDFVEGFTFAHALVFGALISATDPIAVIGLFKSLGAPKRLAVLVEGESLLNDGTAVVFFTLTLALVGGAGLTVGGAVLDFARVVGLGGLVGAAIGLGVSHVVRRVDDAMIEISLTVIAAYGSFVVAEHVHASGVIATVVAGMLCGNFAARTGMSPSTRVAAETFWEYLAFALNSIVFLLIGFEVRLDALLASWQAILAAFAAVTAARAAVIFLSTAVLHRTRERLPWRWSVVLTWGGLRGAVSMVLVLGLVAGFPHRELLVHMTFGVVVLSILLQGLTMSPLMRWLGVAGSREERTTYEVARGQLRAARAALEELEELARQRAAHVDVLAVLRSEYEATARGAEARIGELHVERTALREEELRAARRHLVVVEKDSVLRSLQKGFVGKEAFEKLVADVDARLVRIEGDAGEATPPEPEPAQEGGPQGAPLSGLKPRPAMLSCAARERRRSSTWRTAWCCSRGTGSGSR